MKKLVAAILAVSLLISLVGCRKKPEEIPPESSPEISSESPEPTESPTPTPAAEPPSSELNFAEMQAKNPDIYGYLEIPGSVISQPIVQHPSDDAYYLTHSPYKQKRQSGAVFTEKTYNTKTFDDPVTILYGHRMRTQVMFSTLQALYSDKKSFEAHREIIIYTPDRTLRYEVFAAVPYDNRHILYHYDFSRASSSSLFFKSIRAVHEIGANFAEDTSVTTEDKVLILSTCLRGNNDRRYLVLAKLVPPASAD